MNEIGSWSVGRLHVNESKYSLPEIPLKFRWFHPISVLSKRSSASSNWAFGPGHLRGVGMVLKEIFFSRSYEAYFMRFMSKQISYGVHKKWHVREFFFSNILNSYELPPSVHPSNCWVLPGCSYDREWRKTRSSWKASSRTRRRIRFVHHSHSRIWNFLFHDVISIKNW